ncbi:MAG: hypothetical protein J6J57_05890 [Alistipes sp.]|nr:hypothetical protein [Alistipes sp.]
MKKMMKLLTVVAAAAMGLTACQSSFEETVDANVNVKNSVIVNFVAETTKTAVDTSGHTPIFSWNESEDFVVLEQTSALAKASSVVYTNVDGKADIKAEFDLNAGHSEYQYVAVYPEAGFKSATSLGEAVLILPSEQSAVEGSYDPNADLMVSMPVETDVQPTEAQPMRFTRLAAVAKMTINGLTLAADEVVECVEFTANGKNLAGTIKADLEDPHAFTVETGVSTVSVATTSATEVYFTVLPTLLEAEDAYSVVVVTNKLVYIKQGAIPEGKSLEFKAGKVSRFPVDMTEALVGAKWKLVRDASTLKQGDVVTFVAKNYNYVVGKQTMTAAPIASQTEVVKAGNYLYHNPADATSLDHMLQSYTLMQRDESRVAFDFYNGVDYEDDEVSGFLWATGISGSPKLQAFCDKNTLFYIDITDGTALVEAKDIEKTYKYIRYYHSNYTASSRKFECTSSSPTGNYQICLYRLEGEKREIPPIDAHITVPSSTTSIVITDDGVAEPTVIEEVVFNYVGDWKISVEVEANKEWLDVVYDAENSCLKYTAEKNADPERTAEVKITATLGDKTLEPWTFNMVQKGAPVEYSIEDFEKLEKDENSTYKLTGKVTAVAGKTSEAYVLSDENGNEANIKYLYTEDEESVWGHDDLKIQLGDVMTVVTVPMGSANGGSSAYHSYYKGHYRLTATAGVAADYTGGTVAIEVKTSHNGNIVLPTTPVSGTMAPCDYATFAYTDGAASATVTFTSVNETSYAREATATFTYGLTSAEVTVQQGINPANKLGYEIVFDASTLAVGDEVIIVAKNADKALGVSTSTITSQTNFPGAAIVKSGNVIYDAVEAGVQTFTVAEGSKANTLALTFTHKNSNYYLYLGSTALKGNTSTGNYTSFTIAVDSTSGVATITNSASTAAIITYNATSTKFGTTKVASLDAADETNDIAIYKKQK